MKKILAIGAIIGLVIVMWLLVRPNESRETFTENDTQSQTAGKSELAGTSTYTVSAASSTAEWEGTKTLILDYVDQGTIDVASGSVRVEEGDLVSGSLVFDMSSISAASTGRGSGESQLSNHLKSDDFFAVETYPEARFELTEATQSATTTYTLTGDLTIKGITNEIEFPAEVYAQDDNLVVEAEVVFDRSKWDIRFGSASFFNDLGDNVIGDEIVLRARIVAMPQE